MIKYSKYKSSGIDLLGDIPDCWEVKRLKSLGDIRYGLGQPPKQLPDGLPIIRATNVSFGKITPKNMLFVDPNDLPYDRNPILKTDDIIVVRSGAYTGDSAIIPLEYNGAVTGYDMVYTPVFVSPRFISYSLLSDYVYKDQLIMSSLRAAQPHLNKEELGSTLVALPNKETQKGIVRFLDNKCDAIDKKINLLTKKANYYKEYRKSFINEAVCKGLDKNVKLKDSGIEWIGKIPEHWEVKRLKNIAKTIKGKNLDFFDEPFTNSLPNLSLDYLRNDTVTFNNFCYSPDKSLLADENDIIIIWDGAGVGEILKAKKGFISSTIAKFEFNKSLSSKYFFHLRDNIEYVLKQIPTGMGIPHLNPHILNNFPCPFPSLAEQTQIANFLDHKTQTIDKIVSNINTQIQTLKELRKTLINDAVTGKIKVTNN